MKIKMQNLNRVYSARFRRRVNNFIQIHLQTLQLSNKIYHLRILSQQKEKAAVVRVILGISLKIQGMKRILMPNVTAINLSRQFL